MQRRELLKKTGLGFTAAAGAIASAPSVLAKSRKKVRWSMTIVVPKTWSIWGTNAQKLSDRLKEMSDGKFELKLHSAGELVPALKTFDAVSKGKVQVGGSASIYWQGKIPHSGFFCTLPFGMDSKGMRAWIKYGGGQELWDKAYGKYGVLGFLGGGTGTQMGGWFNKDINSLSDLKGLKMRITGLGGKVFEKVGVSPTLIPGAEIFTSLSTGVIDATEWIGPAHDYQMGFQKVAKNYYVPGWHEPGALLEIQVNKKAWDALPKEYQAMFKAAVAEYDHNVELEWAAKDAEFLHKIKSEGKVKIKSFPEEVLKKLKGISDEVIADIAKSSSLAKETYDSYSAFKAKYDAHQDLTTRALF